MDYCDFRFRVVVDWIEVKIQTAAPTNGWTVRIASGATYADPLDEGPGGAATVFRLRFQDPARWTNITAALDRMHRQCPLNGMPAVTGIEVALDAYGATDAEMAALAASLYWHQTRPASDNVRLAPRFRGDDASMPRTQARLAQALLDGSEIVIGNHGSDTIKPDDIAQRLYLKVSDCKQPLPQWQHRARMEVTLRGSALPDLELDCWASFKFESLAEYWRFRKVKGRVDPLTAVLVQAAPVGERRARRRQGGGTPRLHNGATLADVSLNGRVRDKLRDLSRRWRPSKVSIGDTPKTRIVEAEIWG